MEVVQNRPSDQRKPAYGEEQMKRMAEFVNSVKEQPSFVPIINQNKALLVPQPVKFEFTEIDRPVIAQESDPRTKNQPITNSLLYRRIEDISRADACAWAFTSPLTLEKYYYLHPGLAAQDVRIRVLYAGITQMDVAIARGLLGPASYPLCVGSEIVGEVIATGASVTKFKKGDKVLYGPTRTSCGKCVCCLELKTNLCPYVPRYVKQTNGVFWGGHSTHIQQPDSHCFKLPEGLDIETAAALMCSAVAMYKPLSLYTKKDQKVAIIGIGGLGHIGLQIASKMGLRVDAFVSTNDADPKDRIIPEFGANRIVHWDRDDLKSIECQYDVILNTLPIGIPADRMDCLLNCLKPMGKFIQVGCPPLEQNLTFSNTTVIRRALEIIGSFTGGLKETSDALSFCEKNNVRARAEFFNFDDYPKALARIENELPLFKVILNVDSFSKQFVK
jgi:uncharacterized zinc-type alcohol dehydrogenase-like protein